MENNFFTVTFERKIVYRMNKMVNETMTYYAQELGTMIQ